MKRSINILGVIMFLCFSIILVAGCAKKTPIAEEPIFVTKEKPAAAEQPAGQVAGQESRAALAEKQPLTGAALGEEQRQELAQKELSEGQAVTKELAAKEPTTETAGLPVKGAVEFEDIHFDFDRYGLSPEARGILKRHAAWLLQHKDYNMVIEGHCDERGTTEYNLALGQRRASGAMTFLTDLGVDVKRIKTISYGKELPLDPGHNEEAWAKNRRDHFVVTREK